MLLVKRMKFAWNASYMNEKQWYKRMCCGNMSKPVQWQKTKKPGDQGKKNQELWEKNLLMYWWHQEELKAVDENKVSIYLCFLPFWHSGQNVSWCNKLVTMCLVNQSIKSSLELRIFTALAPKNQFYKTNKNIQGKCIPSACESICLEIFVPYFETVRLSWVSQQNCDTWEVWSCL